MSNHEKDILVKNLYRLAFVNVLLWTLSMVALIFVVGRCPSAKGLFVLLAAGSGVGISIIAFIQRSLNS